VFLGYEPGTKGYRIYDPVKDKLMVTWDVVFDESKSWNWEGNDSRANGGMTKTPDMFQVHWEDTVPRPTTAAEASENDVPDAIEPGSPAASIPSSGGASNSPPHTPSSSPGAPMVQWATPPTRQSVDSNGAPLRYRTIPNLLETTEEL